MVATKAPLLSCKGIHRSFPMGEGELEILKGVDFELFEGEFVAIVGASGAGKSTLMHILGLLDQPNSGEVIYKGKDLSRLDQEKASRLRNLEFGFVFQFFHLLPEFTALENVLLPARMAAGGFGWLRKAKDAEVRAKELLEGFGLGERLGHLPAQLSGGERQRVAIARALVNRPQVVFCDEPTGNLDSQTASEVYALLRKLNREEGQTFLMVTHDDEVAANADRQLRMVDGSFVERKGVTPTDVQPEATPEGKIEKLPPTLAEAEVDASPASAEEIQFDRVSEDELVGALESDSDKHTDTQGSETEPGTQHSPLPTLDSESELKAE